MKIVNAPKRQRNTANPPTASHITNSFLKENNKDCPTRRVGKAICTSANSDQESALLFNFVSELDNRNEDLQLLGLEDLCNQLAAANENYIATQRHRTEETGKKAGLRINEVRRMGNRYIRAILQTTDALLLTSSNAELENFVKELNIETTRVRARLNAKANGGEVVEEENIME